MDLNKIRETLQKFDQEKQQGQGYEDFSDKFWRPKELASFKVRVVPSKYNPDFPFTELAFHTKIRKYPIFALTNLGQQDPVEELRQQLYSTSSKDNWSLAGKLSPKIRYVVPIIVRGEEEKGVRLWEISQTVYKAFLRLAADEEIGDFTDVTDGVDITVERSQGAQFIEIEIRAARKNSPLSTDPKLVEEWLNNQPNPVDCYTHCDYDYIKKQLHTFINGGVAPSSPVQPAASAAEVLNSPNKPEMKLEVKEAPVADTTASLLGAPVKPVAGVIKKNASSVSKFDDLFGEDDDE